MPNVRTRTTRMLTHGFIVDWYVTVLLILENSLPLSSKLEDKHLMLYCFNSTIYPAK